MSVCPWCKVTVPSAASNCPKCGKDPSDHPSISGAGFASLDGFDDMEAPAGDLLLSPSSSSGTGQIGGGHIEFGDDKFGDGFGDDAESESLRLEIEDIPKPVPSMRVGPTAAVVASLSMAPPLRTSAAPGPAVSDLESPAVPVHPALDPYEIGLLADFGPAPSAIWLCPLYAIRVLRRKRELNRSLRAAQKLAAEVEHQRDDQLASIAEKLSPQLQNDREMGGYLAPLAQADNVARDREKALAARSAEYSSIVGVIDQKIAVEESSASAIKTRVDAARAEFELKQQALTRVQGFLKRAEIELRNVQDVARSAAGPDAKTALPEHAAAIVHAQKTVDLRKQDVAGPKAEADVAMRALREVEGQASEFERKINALRSERRRSEGTFSKEMGLRSEGVEHARAERRAALIAIGARLFDTNSALIDKDDFDSFHHIRTDVSSKHLEIERTMRAIASADAAAVKKGWIAIGAAACFVLLLVALVVARLPG